jgi:alkylated DNA repair dioxygenase AlkB
MDLFGNHGDDLNFELPAQDGFSAVWSEARRGFLISVPGGELFYCRQFFDQRISDRTVEYFQENEDFDWRNADWRGLSPDQFAEVRFKNIRWKQDFIRLFGKTHPLPRLTSWYGDSQRSYTYSGITSYPNEWNTGLRYIREQVEKSAGVSFNSVLLNWYRDGEDKIDWHADDEPELGKNPVIGSVNFGETRDFVIRRNDDQQVKVTIPLAHGTLLVMAGALQHHWQHSVPKRAKVRGSRFNLTFRRIGG